MGKKKYKYIYLYKKYFLHCMDFDLSWPVLRETDMSCFLTVTDRCGVCVLAACGHYSWQESDVMWRRWSGQRGALGFPSWTTGGRPVGQIFFFLAYEGQKPETQGPWCFILGGGGSYKIDAPVWLDFICFLSELKVVGCWTGSNKLKQKLRFKLWTCLLCRSTESSSWPQCLWISVKLF